MDIYAKTQLILIEIIHRVEMSKEGVSNQEEVLVLSRKSALVYDEITLSLICLVQVLIWIQFENVVTHLKPDRLHFLSH